MAVRVTLTKGEAESAAGRDLLMLLVDMTGDGDVTADEAARLKGWLEANRDQPLEAVRFLAGIVERILADGQITWDERRELHAGIERVMPKALRDTAAERRAAAEARHAEEEAREAAAAELADAERRRVALCEYEADFYVAGINYENRLDVIEKYNVGPGTRVYFRRDPGNPFSRNATLVLLGNGACIGYVPEARYGEACASKVAACLRKGLRHRAVVESMANDELPIIMAGFYRDGTPEPRTVAVADVPRPNGEGLSEERAVEIIGRASSDGGRIERASAAADDHDTAPITSSNPLKILGTILFWVLIIGLAVFKLSQAK